MEKETACTIYLGACRQQASIQDPPHPETQLIGSSVNCVGVNMEEESGNKWLWWVWINPLRSILNSQRSAPWLLPFHGAFTVKLATIAIRVQQLPDSVDV